MSNYVSWYRKYRPQLFSDVAGQKNMKEILISEIKNNSLASGILFVGQKGTGKTSMAKILAKVVNCTNMTKDGEACNACENCKMATLGSHPDIIEIDAASNNGVDEIRNIKSNVFTMPSLGEKKIFIIDEVHMLTSSAFNAFLKTLEEPPTHVIFILATTEFQKIPATILSRCQTFNFRKIAIDDMKERMKTILGSENLKAEEAVLNEIYYLSDGSLRDALNYLEQLSMVSSPVLSIEKMKSLFSIATKNEKLKIIYDILNKQSKEIIYYFENSVSQGLDVEVLILQLIDIVKEIIEFKITGTDDGFVILNSEDAGSFASFDLEKFFQIADVFASVYDRTTRSNISYQYLLVSILKWINEKNTHISVYENSKHFVKESPIIEKNISKEQDKKNVISEPQVVFANKEQEIVKEPSEIEVALANEKKEIEAREMTAIKKAVPEKKPRSSSVKKTIDINDNKFFETKITFNENELDVNKYKIISSLAIEELPEIRFDHKKILNVLIGATSDQRAKWTDTFKKLFVDGGKIYEIFTVFRDAKIVAACNDAIVLFIDSPIFSKVTNNLLQNAYFRSKLFSELNEQEVIIFCCKKETWKQIKEEYSLQKEEKTLPKYNLDLFNNFYETVTRFNGFISSEDDEMLQRARSIFGDDAIKVVE